jgi:alpha-L-fucosidase
MVRRRDVVSMGLALAAAPSIAYATKRNATTGRFVPTLTSLNAHKLPTWFDDAKFGIFIHWGLYSVPAFAPFGPNPIPKAPDMMKANPYAEWYENSMQFPESETALYHSKTYGDAPYSSFRDPFEIAAANFRASEWAQTFARSGARYVTLVTKHHDGYLLWPSKHRNPNRTNWQSRSDIVGKIAKATRAAGMRFGTYYSGGLDWTFNPGRLDNGAAMIRSMPHDDSYDHYVDQHYRELIARYHPDYLWNDIGYPSMVTMVKLVADFYNGNPDGLVNDRWITAREFLSGTADEQMAKLQTFGRYFAQHRPPPPAHYDVITPEYSSDTSALEKKWETTRGIGFSFGYNAQETEEHLMSAEAIIHLLVNCVAKGGNLLLNVGPRGDGTLCPMQVARLEAVGAWLKVNGTAIYGTRPWQVSEAQSDDGRPVRFTSRDGAVFAIVLDGSDAPLRLSNVGALRNLAGVPVGPAGQAARVYRFAS